MNADLAIAPSDLIATREGADVDRPARADSAFYAGARYYAKANDARAGLPKLERGTFHPYRRLFAVLGKHLPDVEIAKAGGWRDLHVMKRSYVDPLLVSSRAPARDPHLLSAARADPSLALGMTTLAGSGRRRRAVSAVHPRFIRVIAVIAVPPTAASAAAEPHDVMRGGSAPWGTGLAPYAGPGAMR